jgi:hypothetical protein
MTPMRLHTLLLIGVIVACAALGTSGMAVIAAGVFIVYVLWTIVRNANGLQPGGWRTRRPRSTIKHMSRRQTERGHPLD